MSTLKVLSYSIVLLLLNVLLALAFAIAYFLLNPVHSERLAGQIL